MRIKSIISIVILLFISMMTMNAQSVTKTDSKKVSAMLQKSNKWVVLDVRTAEEFSQGHIKGAINIDIRQPNALDSIDKLDHKAKYIVHCRTNHRSKVAADHMIKNGFKTVYQMMDGMDGWIRNKLPTEK